ncbi:MULTISPECIES: radical SAM protein [unclassified Desulfovibrio]|uniref:radical SAM protein n=1 Tax=unclassified Desulfovibrio TaxID=2593640 RepID=UPI002FD98B06
MIDITGVCNYQCSFCYQPHEQKFRGHASFSHLLALIEALRRWGVKEVLYLGGEPTLFPWLAELLRFGHDFGLRQRMITNGGVSLDKTVLRQLQYCAVEVGVSFHGGQASKHDAITGVPKSFNKAVNTVRTLESCGISWWIQYSHINNATNGLNLLVDFLAQKGLRPPFIDVNRLVTRGDNKKATGMPTEEEWWLFLSQFPDWVDTGLPLRVEAHPHCWIIKNGYENGWSPERIKKLLACIRPCSMGFTQWAFSQDGQPKSCPLVEADVLQPYMPPTLSALQQRWESDPSLMRRRSFIFLKNSCLSKESLWHCPLFYDCLGGCRSTGKTDCTHDPLTCGYNNEFSTY